MVPDGIKSEISERLVGQNDVLILTSRTSWLQSENHPCPSGILYLGYVQNAAEESRTARETRHKITSFTMANNGGARQANAQINEHVEFTVSGF
jgi:hypothetical protein